LIFLLGGRQYPWLSLPMTILVFITLCGFIAFVFVEKHAQDPILSIDLFTNRSFSTGNGAVFLSSFAIFPLFAFAPLFIQGVQGHSPMQVGMAMLSLSLGWSLGSLVLGQVIDRMGFRICAVGGALSLICGCAMTLLFTSQTSVLFSFTVFFIVGIGMGMVGMATLLVVQSGLDAKDLGVATSSNQFARTLGGTVGVGVCGGFIANRFSELTQSIEQSGILDRLPKAFVETGFDQIEQLFQPEIQAILPEELKMMVHAAVGRGIREVFWMVLIAALFCLLVTMLIPSGFRGAQSKGSGPTPKKENE
jgi:predicted MFS family arabinose efflux permease